MSLPPAHVGHYLVSLLYLVPVIVLGAGVAWQRRKDRRAELEGTTRGDGEHDAD